jgi:tetratricopeptide (TPR) repeat protein
MISPWSLRLCLLLGSLAGAPAQAEGEFKWPEKSQNLQVLPKDFDSQRLRSVMTQFSTSLGVRCSHCHVGEEGKPLGTFDFVSDKNPNKDRAREMYRMLGSINEHLEKIQPSGDKRVNMWCHTCHRGRARPMTLEEELGGAYRKGGSAAAVARYRELKEQFYGKNAFDFSEGTLNGFAYFLLEQKDRDAAIAIFRLNAAEYPHSGNVWDSLGEAYLSSGNKLLAEIYYRKSLEVDPTNGNAGAKLRELSGTRAPPAKGK